MDKEGILSVFKYNFPCLYLWLCRYNGELFQPFSGCTCFLLIPVSCICNMLYYFLLTKIYFYFYLFDYDGIPTLNQTHLMSVFFKLLFLQLAGKDINRCVNAATRESPPLMIIHIRR